jgi:serine/threonine protein kinase
VDRGLQTLFQQGDTIDGRYGVLEVLGSGASGVVYGVYDNLGDRKVALKVLWDASSGDDPELKRLRREIKASQLAPCPRLVAVHDLIMTGDRPALVMEWVEGRSLKETIAREGTLPWRRAADVATELLEALVHLHGLGIVHRDVKPGNILTGRDGIIKLGDFGLAKGEDLGASLTQTGATLGTPGYMAPEVIRGKEATSVSDLYSVGVVLFEMLTGLLPYRGTTALEIASRQLADPPPLHLLKKHDVPAWLVRIVARLLERDPGDRFPSAKAALEALTKRSAGFAVARRWRVRAAVAAAVVCAAAGAREILQEAYRLAPASWRPLLQDPAR